MPQTKRLSIRAGAALLVLALFGIVAFAAVSRLSTQQQAVVETNGGISTAEELLVATYDAERAGTNYILTGAEESLAAFTAAKGRIEDALDGLRVRTEDRPRQRMVLDTLGQLIGARVATLNEGISARKRQGAAATAVLAQGDSTRARGGLLPLVQRLREEELVVLGERTRLMSRNGKISRMVVLGGSIVAFLVAAAVLVPVRTENA